MPWTGHSPRGIPRTERCQETCRHLNDATYVPRTEQPELTIDQALPTLTHAVNRHSEIERTARDGTDCRIHPGGIATTCEDRNVLHRLRL